MHVMMDLKHIETIAQVARFIEGSKGFIVKANTIQTRYEVIVEILNKFNYLTLSNKEKYIIRTFIKNITGYKKSQLAHVIELGTSGKLVHKDYVRSHIYRKYTGFDIRLLELTDEAHYRLSAAATHEILRREYEVFAKKQYKQVSEVSPSHINNLRERPEYKDKSQAHTQARQIPIGETKKPEPNGRPGSIRIDTVSQRDIYLINSIDEVTQWEVVIAVPAISEKYLKPALELLLKQYPFIIFNFHSDRGSEFINHTIARLLNKLLIHQTKSRSRHCNDQALVEGKNGSIIRKNFGYGQVSKEVVGKMNLFYEHWFNPYLNYHRPCGYVTGTKTDHKGREQNIYGEYTTPYEKLKEISTTKKTSFLTEGTSFTELNKIAYARSDNDFATQMRTQQYELTDIINLLNARP